MLVRLFAPVQLSPGLWLNIVACLSPGHIEPDIPLSRLFSIENAKESSSFFKRYYSLWRVTHIFPMTQKPPSKGGVGFAIVRTHKESHGTLA